MQKWLTYLFIAFSLIGFGQHKLEGTWQGLLTQFGEDWDKSYIIFFDFKIDKEGRITGKIRDEAPYSGNYAIKVMEGVSSDSNRISYSQKRIEDEVRNHGVYWCLSDGELKYDDETGYLRGKWTSTNCKRTWGHVILYRSKLNFSTEAEPMLSHHWRDKFITELKQGKDAPDIRELRRNNFVFKPIYFDHDKSDIRPEYDDYLKKMSSVILDHSDLRIKVIGHTDAVGTDQYNVGLSQRRADALKERFKQLGVKEDRVVIDFKGERKPVATNSNPEGKQLNRRVDFKFI